MNKTEFKDLIEAYLINIRYLDNCVIDLKDGCITLQARTGGSEGGNCWRDGESRPYTNEVDPRSVSLDYLYPFLNKHYPKLTLAVFSRILGLETSEAGTAYEYYGNYTNYLTKSLNVDKLYDLLNCCE